MIASKLLRLCKTGVINFEYYKAIKHIKHINKS